jgi:hypothetical protein
MKKAASIFVENPVGICEITIHRIVKIEPEKI